jgi:hypothetical protein
MVQRASEAAQFGSGNKVQVAGTNVAFTRPDTEKYAENHEASAPFQTEHSGDRLLARIAGVATQLGNQMMQVAQEEAYLAGAAKAGTIKSEEELETNPLTSAWTKAGYRDTMGRVAVAEAEAKLASDMPKLREKTPEEFNEYMAKRRADLMPTLEGMSRKQRTAVFQNLLMIDRASIKTHTNEHTKYLIEVETRSIQGAVRASKIGMDNTKGNVDAYRAATESAFATLNSTVLQNPKLTPQLRAQFIEEAAQFALDSDHTQLYRMLKETQLPMPDGTTNTMSSQLSWESEVKLSKNFRESQVRTEGMRAAESMQMQARMQADWKDEDSPLMPEQSVLDFGAVAIQNGFMNADQYKGFMQDYYTQSAKKADNGDLANAWASGDQGKMISLNKTDQEGLEAWKAKYGRNLTPEQFVDTLAAVGIGKGRVAALNELGKQLAPGLAQIGVVDAIDPANSAMVGRVIGMLDRSEREGKTGLFAAVMSSYPPESQAKMMHIREGIAESLTPEVSIARAAARMVEESKLTPQQRAAMGEAGAKEDAQFLLEMEPRSLLDTIGMRVKSVFSTDTGNMVNITPRSSWFENPERVAEAGASAKYAAAQELQFLSRAHPFMSPDARRTAALAAVSARTVQTEGGMFVLPRKVSAQAFFGVPASTGKERIGAAIDEFIKPGEGNRIVFSAPDGKFMFVEYNATGGVVRNGMLDPKQIAPMVAAQQDREQARYKAIHGVGNTVNGVTFNGDNTSGLSNEMVHNTRHALLTNKAMLVTPSNPAQMAQLNNAFKMVTDKAMKYVQVPMKATARASQESLTFFTELAIATDNTFAGDKAYRPMLSAMRDSNPAPAIAALRTTEAYKKADPATQARYEAAINNILKGR